MFVNFSVSHVASKLSPCNTVIPKDFTIFKSKSMPMSTFCTMKIYSTGTIARDNPSNVKFRRYPAFNYIVTANFIKFSWISYMVSYVIS